MDWKYLFATTVALAGVSVPVWLWKYDLQARALTVRSISSVALQAVDRTAMPDIVMTLDGKPIDSPVLSTLEIANTGAKPITSVDFESPIEISSGERSAIIRTRVLKVIPVGLKPEVTGDQQSIKVMPLLLNPEDRLVIAVLTSGSMPKFPSKPASRVYQPSRSTKLTPYGRIFHLF
jgi:hypothetical protein